MKEEGNRNTRRKPLATSFRKCHILKPENSSPKRDSNPHNSIGGRLRKQTCKPLHHASPRCRRRRVACTSARPPLKRNICHTNDNERVLISVAARNVGVLNVPPPPPPPPTSSGYLGFLWHRLTCGSLFLFFFCSKVILN